LTRSVACRNCGRRSGTQAMARGLCGIVPPMTTPFDAEGAPCAGALDARGKHALACGRRQNRRPPARAAAGRERRPAARDRRALGAACATVGESAEGRATRC
jgi:hypothetical protein